MNKVHIWLALFFKKNDCFYGFIDSDCRPGLFFETSFAYNIIYSVQLTQALTFESDLSPKSKPGITKDGVFL